jgi:hypothetical protein
MDQSFGIREWILVEIKGIGQLRTGMLSDQITCFLDRTNSLLWNAQSLEELNRCDVAKAVTSVMDVSRTVYN